MKFKKTTKKLLPLIIAVCFIVSLSVFTSSAYTLDDGYQTTYNGTIGDSIEWFVDRNTDTMTISGTGAIPDYADNDDCPLYRYKNMVSNLVIEDGITAIGDYAFSHAEYTNITLGKDIARIGKRAFYWSSVQTINFPENLAVIDAGAFTNCLGLTKLDFPDKLIEIGASCFWGCSNLAEYSIPDSVTTIGKSAFHGTAIESITIPDSVTAIEYGTFSNCEKLKEVNLGKGVKTIDNIAFRYCPIEIIELPEGLTTLIEGCFWPCEKLQTVILPVSVTTIGKNVFAGCSLKDIYYGGTPEQFEAINVGANNYLTAATIHYNYNPNIYENIDTIITNDILTISGNGSLPTVEAGASHYWDEYAETATAIVIDGEITTIGSNSFTGFSNISTIIIRTPSITIEPDAFVNCPLLENVLIFGNSSFTPESFNGCADAIKVFENADKQHSFTTSDNTINVIPFSFEDTTLQWNGKLTLDAYNFFDIIAAFCNKYDEVKSIKVNSFTGEGFTFYRYNEKTYNSEPIEGNTLNNAEFSVLIDSYETGPVYITFNQLCDGITDGSISTFYLIVEDETEDDILDTEVEVKDEEEKSWFEKALEWIVSLLNKLFKILSRFK